jgi:hypothetical protein
LFVIWKYLSVADPNRDDGWQEMSSENKLRLLMIYTVTHPEKLDETKQMQWMKVFLLFPLYLLLFPHQSSTYCHLEQVYTISVVHEQRLWLQVCFSWMTQTQVCFCIWSAFCGLQCCYNQLILINQFEMINFLSCRNSLIRLSCFFIACSWPD